MRIRSLFMCLSLLISFSEAIARTWYILPDGMGDAPTIEAGLDSAAVGDTVLLASGIYRGQIPIEFPAKAVTLVSEENDPTSCVIDCDWFHRAFTFGDGVTDQSVVQGVTIRNGDCTRGGAIYCYWGASPMIRNCIFLRNTASEGGAIWADNGTRPFIADCVFVENTAQYGGAFWLSGSHPMISRCTMFGNHGLGSGIYCDYYSEAVIENTIVAFSPSGIPIYSNYEGHFRNATVACCDIYGNAAGDWVDCVTDRYGIGGNFSAHPLFCDPANGDFSLMECSPCAPGNHPDGYSCELVGALDVGCDCSVSAQSSTWSAIKSIYK